MQIADGEVGSRHMHREVCLGASRQCIDITVSTMFWATRDRARRLSADFTFQFFTCTACVYIDLIGGLRNNSACMGMLALGNELSFPAIPLLQDFS